MPSSSRSTSGSCSPDRQQKKDPALEGAGLSDGNEGRQLLRGFFLDVFDHVSDALELLSILVGNFDSEFFFESHDELDGIERVGTEVFDEGCAGGDLLGCDAELLDNDFFDFFFDGFFGHNGWICLEMQY